MWSSVVNFILTAASMVPFFGPPPVLPVSEFRLGSNACLHPTERREWRTLSKAERAEWISAVKCLAGMPHNNSIFAPQNLVNHPSLDLNSSYYDDFIYVHMNLVEVIHRTGYFLPWHRNIIHVFETAIKDHCSYKGAIPYWDPTKDASDVYNSPLFTDSDPDSGLGGWGNPAADFEVQDGAFSGFKLSYPYPHTLRRNFTLRPWLDTYDPNFPIDRFKLANESFTPSAVANLVNGHVGDLEGFQTEMVHRQGTHWALHQLIGADMAGLCTGVNPHDTCKAKFAFTPNDPLFFLFHAGIDKIWTDWQNRHPENAHIFNCTGSTQREGTRRKYPCGGPPNLNLNSPLPSNGLFGHVTIEDVFSTTSGVLCYTYV